MMRNLLEMRNERAGQFYFQFFKESGSLGLVHWDDPEGWYGKGGGRGGSGWGTRVYPWQMHVAIWQNQYNIVK